MNIIKFFSRKRLNFIPDLIASMVFPIAFAGIFIIMFIVGLILVLSLR